MPAGGDVATWRLIHADVMTGLCGLASESVRCVVTSPPYWRLRDYGHPDQFGLEPTPEEYTANMVRVFREVWRVLAPDGTLWLNLGDTFAANSGPQACLKPKDLVGIPWRVAFALQEDGWYLRSDIVWHKPNPMPESVTDRPTRAHEYLFLLTKSARYYYNADAIAEPVQTDPSENYPARARITGRGDQGSAAARGNDRDRSGGFPPRSRSGNQKRKYGEDVARPGSHLGRSIPWEGEIRNRRSVWTIATRPFPGTHFATFPPQLIEPAILAGSEPGDTVLDPFAGAGTTLMVALRHGRSAVGIDVSEEYIDMARRRIHDDSPLFNGHGEAAP